MSTIGPGFEKNELTVIVSAVIWKRELGLFVY